MIQTPNHTNTITKKDDAYADYAEKVNHYDDYDENYDYSDENDHHYDAADQKELARMTHSSTNIMGTRTIIKTQLIREREKQNGPKIPNTMKKQSWLVSYQADLHQTEIESQTLGCSHGI